MNDKIDKLIDKLTIMSRYMIHVDIVLEEVEQMYDELCMGLYGADVTTEDLDKMERARQMYIKYYNKVNDKINMIGM